MAVVGAHFAPPGGRSPPPLATVTRLLQSDAGRVTSPDFRTVDKLRDWLSY